MTRSAFCSAAAEELQCHRRSWRIRTNVYSSIDDATSEGGKWMHYVVLGFIPDVAPPPGSGVTLNF